MKHSKLAELTDKIGSGLATIYKELLKDYQDKPITFLEIGVWKGGSMLLFEELLPAAKIYGIDILDRPEVLKDSKVITRVIDQNDTGALVALAEEAGGFDFIIDDGTHFKKETENSFYTLWKYLNSGGKYIIEDWAVGLIASKAGPYSGIDDLIYKITSEKVSLGISEMRIVVKKDMCSYALFGKR